jgi:hypothetical protein
MEIKSILVSQAIRFFGETGPVLDVRSPVPLIDGIRAKYGFVQIPQNLAELDFKKGVSFFHGYYKGKIIDKLSVYENGLLCEARHNTDLSDEFMSELLAWAAQEHDLRAKETGVKAYVSQLEVTASVDVSSIFSKFASLGAFLASLTKEYNEPVPDYRISGLKMHYDSMSIPVPRPAEFSFERRAAELYSSNQYFSSAPVRTEDHLRVLEELEKLFS